MAKKGEIKDKTGEESFNKFGSKIVVKSYKSYKETEIYFPKYDWSIITSYQHFKERSVRCPYERRIYGIGYIGEGKYKPSENGKETKEYLHWRHILMRCYDNKYKEKEPTYYNCEVCEEWHNFQNFAKWYEENYYEVEGQSMNLDKDILIKGNKIYSPQTCVFVPQNINKLFTKRQNHRGEYPIGVSWHKKDKAFRVCVSDGNGKLIYLGNFSNSHEAFLIYKINKELIIQEIANIYKDSIPLKLYNALIEYKVEEND